MIWYPVSDLAIHITMLFVLVWAIALGADLNPFPLLREPRIATSLVFLLDPGLVFQLCVRNQHDRAPRIGSEPEMEAQLMT